MDEFRLGAEKSENCLLPSLKVGNGKLWSRTVHFCGKNRTCRFGIGLWAENVGICAKYYVSGLLNNVHRQKKSLINTMYRSFTWRSNDFKTWPGKTFSPVWSLIKVFTLKNSVVKSLQKIWSENSQKRRPRGSSIKHGEIWPAKFGQMYLPLIFQVYLLHLSEL